MKFIIGFLLGLIILPLCGYMYFRLGYAPVATAASPMPFEKKLAGMALQARIHSEAPKDSPVKADEPNLTAGAKIYVENCSFCHGMPNQASAPPPAKGMFPVPPQLFDEMVTDDPVGTTYWKVSNGIRMSGMPAFNKSLSSTQIWQVTELLANADKLPDATKAVFWSMTISTPPKK